MDAVITENLRKIYGPTVALDGLSLNIKEGQVFGLIGPNGSGKTTTLRILSTLIRPTEGSASIFGVDVLKDPDQVRQMLGYLPEEAGVYKNLTGNDYLRFIASLYSKTQADADAMVSRGAEISGLGDRLKDNAGGYSQGMRRRLLISRVMMLRPKLAILDEPTSGLDVVHSTHVRNLIRKYVSDYGVTVLLSSHNMLEVDFLCDLIVLVNKGRVVASGTPTGVKEEQGASNLEDAFMKVIAHG
ncbi:MAG TPA: ABC transporter ATP-binding protein [Nitrososphaerales archaeon]|nr:ABC transporter ATP-binding protein [Nitrososphaerales archaeon]